MYALFFPSLTAKPISLLNLLLVVLLMGVSVRLSSQTDSLNTSIQWAASSKTWVSLVDYLGTDNKGNHLFLGTTMKGVLFFGAGTIKETMSLEVYSSKMQHIESKKLDLPVAEGAIAALQNIGGFSFHASNLRDIGTKRALKINGKPVIVGKLFSEDKVVLFHSDLKLDQHASEPMEVFCKESFEGKVMDYGAKYNYSGDSSFIYTTFSTRVKQVQTNHFLLFDETFKESFHVQYTLPEEKERYTLLSTALSNEGEVYQIYSKFIPKSERKDKKVTQMLYLVYLKPGQEAVYTEMDKLVPQLKYPRVTVNKNQGVFLTGFTNDGENTSSNSLLIGVLNSGSLMSKYSVAIDAIKHVVQNDYDTKPKSSRKAKKKEEDEEEEDLSINIDQIQQNEKGELLLLAEQSNIYSFNNLGISGLARSSFLFNYGDIYAIKVNADHTVKWMEKINRYYAYESMSPLTITENRYIARFSGEIVDILFEDLRVGKDAKQSYAGKGLSTVLVRMEEGKKPVRYLIEPPEKKDDSEIDFYSKIIMNNKSMILTARSGFLMQDMKVGILTLE